MMRSAIDVTNEEIEERAKRYFARVGIDPTKPLLQLFVDIQREALESVGVKFGHPILRYFETNSTEQD